MKKIKLFLSSLLNAIDPTLAASFLKSNLKHIIKMEPVQLTAYCVKTKQKNCPILDAVITKTLRGAYMAQGHDGNGNKLTALLGEQKALAAIKAGVAKQGW